MSGLRPAAIAAAWAGGLACIVVGCGPLRTAGERRATDAAAIAALGSQAQCMPRFPDEGGWFGGDAAVSVAVPGGDGRTSLWFFGDSFVASPDAPAGRHFPFVHNAVARSHCDRKGGWQIDYAWRRARGPRADGSQDSRPDAFFVPDEEAAWVAAVARQGLGPAYYWPLAAVAIDEGIGVALLRVAPAPPSGPFALPFRTVGADLAWIANPRSDPEDWRIRLAALSRRPDILPTTALVATRAHLYVFATLDRGDGRRPRVLLRLPRAALDRLRRPEALVDLEPDLETWTRDGEWKPGIDLEAARIVMGDDASEMTVHFDPSLNSWLAVYVDPTTDVEDAEDAPGGIVPAEAVLLRRAARLEGPWSEPVALWRMPEVATTDDPLPGRPVCYAGRAHPQFAGPGELLVSWVCNVFSEAGEDPSAVLERLRTDSSLYRPRTIRLPLPNSRR